VQARKTGTPAARPPKAVALPLRWRGLAPGFAPNQTKGGNSLRSQLPPFAGRLPYQAAAWTGLCADAPPPNLA